MISKIKNWADKFESKWVRIVAFWGILTGMIAGIPSGIAGIVWLYFFFVDISNISNYVKEFRRASEYSYFMDMQSQSIDHEEMQSDTMFGVVLQKTNYGDLYYFDTITINGKIRPIVYGASVKNKANKNGLHVYVTDLGGNVRWIEPTIKQ